jgi:MFS family permease
LFNFAAFIPLYAVTLYKMTILQSGLILSVNSVFAIVATLICSFFVMRWGYHWPLIIGSVLLAAGCLILGLEPREITIFGAELSPLAILMIVGILGGLSMGVSGPAAGNACIDLLPQRASTISGVRSMFVRGGGAVGVAIMTLLIQYFNNIKLGFEIAFIAMGAITLLSIPFILAMPGRALSASEASRAS